jgi:ketosteroid isomerase-like protein
VSEENVEIVRQAFDAFNSGGEDWIEFFDSEATLHDPPEWVDRTVHRRHDGIRHAVALWTENFSEFRWDIERLTDAGDCVTALVTQRGRIKQSDAWVEQPVGAVCEVREGNIVRLSIYFSWDEALKTVGLEIDTRRGAERRQ